MDFLKQLWHTVKSNPFFVAVSTAICSVVLDFLTDYITKGALDTSPAGMKKLLTVMGIAVATAIVHLYRPTPLQSNSLQSMSQKNLGCFALMALLLVGTMPMQGCTVTSAQIQADGQAIAQALDNVANQLEAANPDLAAKLHTSASSISAITANWQTGNALVEFNNVANAAEIVLSEIPITAPYAALVSIAVAAIDILVANVNPNTPLASSRAAARGPSGAALAEYRYRGEQMIHHRMLRSKEGDLKAAWNDTVKTQNLDPSLALK